MSPFGSIVGGVVFIITIRLIGVTLGRQHPCPTMRRARIICGAVLYTLAACAIVSGVMGLWR